MQLHSVFIVSRVRDRARSTKVNRLMFQLTNKLEGIDRRTAVWSMKNLAAVAVNAESKTHNQYEAVLLGYNTRITDDEVLAKVGKVFGISGDVSKVVTKVYDSGK